MQFLYKVRFQDGSSANIISDFDGLHTVANRVQQTYGKRLEAISHRGAVKEVNEYNGNPMTNLKAEIKHHVKRIEESVGTYNNGRNKDILNETEAIRELIKE